MLIFPHTLDFSIRKLKLDKTAVDMDFSRLMYVHSKK